jgi:hypothetical protein
MVLYETQRKTGVNGEYPWGRQEQETVDFVSAVFVLRCFNWDMKPHSAATGK